MVIFVKLIRLYGLTKMEINNWTLLIYGWICVHASLFKKKKKMIVFDAMRCDTINEWMITIVNNEIETKRREENKKKIDHKSYAKTY